jgi:hypothetical protein
MTIKPISEVLTSKVVSVHPKTPLSEAVSVIMHNGKIWVEDNPEGGCIFIVEIPKRQNNSFQKGLINFNH